MKNISKMTADELAKKADGIGPETATRIIEFLNNHMASSGEDLLD